MLKIEKLTVNDNVVKRNLKAVHRGDALLQLKPASEDPQADAVTAEGKFHVSRVGTGWMAEVSVAYKTPKEGTPAVDVPVEGIKPEGLTLALTAKIRRMVKKGEQTIDISDIYTGDAAKLDDGGSEKTSASGVFTLTAAAPANKMYEITFPLADATPATDPDASTAARVLKAGEYHINILSRLVDDPEGTNMPNPTSFTVTRHCKANLDLA